MRRIFGLLSAAALLFTAAPVAAQQQPARPGAEFARTSPNAAFSQFVRVGDVVYTAGMLGTAPGQGLVPGGIEPETRQTLENLKAALERAGASMDDVVKCTVFLADFAEWGAMNRVYVTFFPNNRPARSAVEVSGMASNARVEIECIAHIGAGAAAAAHR
jgi:2-iminobutanoate/2-iminopropanoate deaminase